MGDEKIRGLAAGVLISAMLGGAAFGGDHPGRRFFEEETFGGNGRTCQSCHRQGSRTISPAEAQALFAEDPADPLFQGDARDDFGKTGPCLAGAIPGVECPPTFARFLADATIVVGIDLHDAVSVDGSSARTVFVNRGVPTTLDTPALVLELMADGRAPTLEEQARGALSGHAAVPFVRQTVLEKIAAFETTEFSRPELAAFAGGGPPPGLPEGNTESEKRGRGFFVTPTELGKDGFCGLCHAGPMLNEVALDLALPTRDHLPLDLAAGDRFSTAFVSERNALANPERLWSITGEDGLVRSIVSPDIGRAAITGRWLDVNEFKIPPLWNARNTAPYFHDNSAKTLEELVDHYANVVAPTFQIVLTPEDRADIVAYLGLL